MQTSETLHYELISISNLHIEYEGDTMGFLERIDRNMKKIEKQIEKEEQKKATLDQKLSDKSITKAKHNIDQRKIDQKIRAMKKRIRDLQGMALKEKKHIEEKQKKKEEKKKKKKK